MTSMLCEQARGMAIALVMYPDVLSGECVPKFPISDEHGTMKKPKIDNPGEYHAPSGWSLRGARAV